MYAATILWRYCFIAPNTPPKIPSKREEKRGESETNHNDLPNPSIPGHSDDGSKRLGLCRPPYSHHVVIVVKSRYYYYYCYYYCYKNNDGLARLLDHSGGQNRRGRGDGSDGGRHRGGETLFGSTQSIVRERHGRSRI